MYKLQNYIKVRQAYGVENKSVRTISREFGIHRRTVRKMIENINPPGYVRVKEVVRPKLDDHKAWIDEILEADKVAHHKQRHTAKQLHNRLKNECGFTGSYTIVREYVAKKKLKTKEMFVPLNHDTGTAQADFGEAQVVINGVECKAHFLVMTLPQSDAFFVKAYPAENTESFCEAHASAFKFFEGVPRTILYDNTKIAVTKILGDGQRSLTNGFLALQSHYLFSHKFAAPARGNEKGTVENRVGCARRNFMVPRPEFESFDAFNAHLEECCLKSQAEIKRGHSETVEDRLRQDKAVFLPLPQTPYESCRIQAGKINSQALVRFQNNDYSVPTSLGRQKILVKGFVDRVEIFFENKRIASHQRCYGAEEIVFNPIHYLKLLERKIGAFEQAAPLKNWKLPPIFQKTLEILCLKNPKEGRRSYVRILQFLENDSVEDLSEALKVAISLNVINSESAIKHLLRRHVEGRPANLSLADHPKIPYIQLPPPDCSIYNQLLAGGQ